MRPGQWLSRMSVHHWVILSGALMGAAGAGLAVLGNPVNSGICISCFLENAAGALGLHSNPRMQYIRPELLGFFLGSFAAALAGGEFRTTSRGQGALSLGFGILMMAGCAVFIGCPIKAVLRLAAGDLTSLAGLIGLVGGVWGGIRLLRTGEVDGGGERRAGISIVALGAVAVGVVLTALSFEPGFLRASRVGAGAMHAPVLASLVAGLVIGAVCQRSRFCITGSIRDVLLTRSPWPVAALGALLVAAVLGNSFAGQFRVGYYDQPGAHLDALWSGLGMGLVGLVGVVAGGCPFRQIVKAGEGNLDALTVVLGMVVGAAMVQAWGLGATTAGVPAAGKVAVLLGWAAVCSLGMFRKEESL